LEFSTTLFNAAKTCLLLGIDDDLRVEILAKNRDLAGVVLSTFFTLETGHFILDHLPRLNNSSTEEQLSPDHLGWMNSSFFNIYCFSSP
jgi:hypothetical protein